jgi:major membrane immunogen (membrane-anchored lipoprotein)
MKAMITLTTILILLFSFSTTKGEFSNDNLFDIKDTSSNYIDGTFQGKSQAKYAPEPFWGHIQISIENGSFTDIQFAIRDSSIHESVDSMYGVRNYSYSANYMQQCVKDGNGIKNYPKKLLQTQNLDEVDAVSGATWSYNIFKASVKEALKNTKATTGIEENRDLIGINFHILPNPFYSKLKLEYSLTKNCSVNLSFYDSQGKFIKNLVNREQHAGHYSFYWNDCTAAGIYYYRMTLDGKEYSGKLINLKK